MHIWVKKRVILHQRLKIQHFSDYSKESKTYNPRRTKTAKQPQKTHQTAQSKTRSDNGGRKDYPKVGKIVGKSNQVGMVGGEKITKTANGGCQLQGVRSKALF